MSIKKIILLGFCGPAVILVGALISVALGRGQTDMLPSTVAALAYYGILIAIGIAWRDAIPHQFRWMPTFDRPKASRGLFIIRAALVFVVVLSVGAIAAAALAWFARTLGVSSLLWRPLFTIAICVWLGVALASVVRPQATA